jgi:hypothetical protein
MTMDCPKCWGTKKDCSRCKGAGKVPDQQLSPHFRLSELLASNTAKSKGLDNDPSPEIEANLKALCEHVLEPIRAKVGPLKINSGYRSDAVNKAVGGSLASMHKIGAAADIKVDGLTAVELVEAILLADIDFDQVIAYATTRGGHVHIGIKPGASARHRKQILWAPTEGGYIPFDRAPRAP